MTREEFESILEEAFMAGYEDAIGEIFDEDYDFDLEDDADSYTEDAEYYDYYNEARDDSKLDRFRKAVVKGLDAPAKELGFSDKTRKSIGKAVLSGTGRMNPVHKAKAFAKHLGRAITGATRDSGKVAMNVGSMGTRLGYRTLPAVDKLEHEFNKRGIEHKGNVMERIFKNRFDRMGKSVRKKLGTEREYPAGTSFNSEEEFGKAMHKLNKHNKKVGNGRTVIDSDGKPY